MHEDICSKIYKKIQLGTIFYKEVVFKIYSVIKIAILEIKSDIRIKIKSFLFLCNNIPMVINSILLRKVYLSLKEHINNIVINK